MIAAPQNTNAKGIACAILSNLRGERVPSFPLPSPHARVSEVQLWIDRWNRSASADQQCIEDAVELAASDAAKDNDHELIAGAFRLLRRIRARTISLRPLGSCAKQALADAARPARFKGIETSYGDLHAELLACIGQLRVKADDLAFWAGEMNDPRYVASAASGCLDSGSRDIARQGIMRAVKKHDPTLPFSLDRLFRLHHPKEDEVWDWFVYAYAAGYWTDEDWQRMADAAIVFDRLAPDPHRARAYAESRKESGASALGGPRAESSGHFYRSIVTSDLSMEERYSFQGKPRDIETLIRSPPSLRKWASGRTGLDGLEGQDLKSEEKGLTTPDPTYFTTTGNPLRLIKGTG